MSLVFPCLCPVSECKYHTRLVYADFSQIKHHLRYDHDYREKQETAFRLGIINSPDEKRSPTWLVDSLSDFSRV